MGLILRSASLANSTDDVTVKGSIYFNSSTNMMYIYNGTAWKSASFA